MKKWNIFFILLLLGVALPFRIVAEPTSLTPEDPAYWTQKINRCFNKKSVVHARVQQDQLHHLRDKPQTQTATIAYALDGRFKLSYANGNTVFNNGKRVVAYDKRNHTAVMSPLRQNPLASAFLRFVDPEKSSNLLVRYVKTVHREGQPSLHVFQLTPTNETESFVKSMLVTLVDDCFVLRRLVLLDRENNAIRMTFTEHKMNKLKPKTLSYTVPKGTKTIRP